MNRLRIQRIVLAATLGLVPATAAAQTTPEANTPPPQPPVHVDWNPRPSIRLGSAGRIDFRLKLQGDVRSSDADDNLETFRFERRRAGIEGVLFDRIGFEVERDLRADGQWRDVFVNLDAANWLELKAGRFKVPFGLEATTGATDLDFVFRTLASETIAPGRDRGTMVHGRIRRVLTYEAAIFQRDGDRARLTEPAFLLPGESEPTAGRMIAVRLVTAPFPRGRHDERPRIGIAATSSNLPEGLNSLRGETVFGTRFFDPVYVRGRRTRIGGQAEWNPGRFGFRAEYTRAADERRGQGLGDVDLSDLVTRGWYASGTWAITGGRKADGLRPRSLRFARNVGAVEIGTRIEDLWFGSALREGPAFRNPRAAHIESNSARIWTGGLNWYPNRWVKVQANTIREHIRDGERTPIVGRQTYWSSVVRLQVVL